MSDREKATGHLSRAWALYLDALLASPRMRGMILGAGLAFDPLPMRRYRTFLRSDVNALRADWEAVGNDLRSAITRIALDNDLPLGAHDARVGRLESAKSAEGTQAF